MVLTQDGSVWAAGRNNQGQLGDGTTTERHSFVKVIPGGVTAVAAGGHHTMVLKQDGSVWATGFNGYGQLGDGSKTDRHSFVKVVPSGVKAVAAAGGSTPAMGTHYGEHSMLLKKDGSVWATGDNKYGRLGDGTTTQRLSFVKVVPRGVTAIAAGGTWEGYSMVLQQDGSVWATGRNNGGQLGDGTTTDRLSFVKVAPSGVTAIGAGDYHSMVLKKDGSVWTTGRNNAGQIGDGTTTERHSFVKVVSSGVTAIAAGGSHSMVLKQDGSVWATGANYWGQIGDGTDTPWARYGRKNFVKVVPSGVTAVAAGNDYSMVLKKDGSVWGTGANTYGRLGIGTGAREKKSFVKAKCPGCVTTSAVFWVRVRVKGLRVRD